MDSSADRDKNTLRTDALRYHSKGQAGKIEITPTKALATQYDLSLAYSPGVAEPCLEIQKDINASYRYTARGNLVAIISNGTAVLGLGDIGAAASKPVMEGKAVLFKKFAGIDAFDIEVDCTDSDEFIATVARLQLSFGGINLEDIRAPECFYIERQLCQRCDIPVMHDDQHGTAIISGAALLNALLLTNRDITKTRVVVLGAGAAAIACANFYIELGVQAENVVMCDKNGPLRRDSIAPTHPAAHLATTRMLSSFDEAMVDADMLLGLSVGNIVQPHHLQAMAPDPILFVLANPTPEIAYSTAQATRPDAIIATGRSDYPNQVNNVLGFPFIFRGALDVGAQAINETMKIAAARALAQLAQLPVPDIVRHAYSESEITFGKQYLIPKPFDPRLLTTIAPAVARAAMETGVSRHPITDWQRYENELLERVGIHQKLVSVLVERARLDPKRVIFSGAEDYRMLGAAQMALRQGIAIPILLGERARIEACAKQYDIGDIDQMQIIDPIEEIGRCHRYAETLFARRQRKGVTLSDARQMMRQNSYFGASMLELNEADALLAGGMRSFALGLRPILQTIGTADGVARAAGLHILNTNNGVYFFADTAVNVAPSVDDLVDIIALTAATVSAFHIEPVMAVISHSNFGSLRNEESERCRMAIQRVGKLLPNLIIDGEICADIALNRQLLNELYPFSPLAQRPVNTFIFSTLTAGTAAYQLVSALGNAEVIGPILMGMHKPVQVLQLGLSERIIFNMCALSVIQSQIAQRG